MESGDGGRAHFQYGTNRDNLLRARVSHKQVSSVEDAWKRTQQTQQPQQVFLALVAAASSQQTDDEVPSEAELADWLSPCLN